MSNWLTKPLFDSSLQREGYAMSPAFRLTLIWIAGCLLAFVTAMNFMPASLVDGHYIPVSNDSFYHARRILDTVADPSSFYEFDPLIHYPAGSWITWPWAYDYVMAGIVRAALWALGPREPMTVLAYIPVFAIAITIALAVAIASVLRLSMAMRALAVLSLGISPLTQTIHGIGMVDHHFAEHIFILLSLLLGILWFRTPASVPRAAALGLVLAASLGVHNGLFILQLPLLGALLLTWLRNEPPPMRSTAAFAVCLFAGTLLIALPADALWLGEFEFYLLSWFHVYVAGCTSLIALFFARCRYSPRQFLLLSGVGVVLLIPLVAQVIVGGSFISGSMDMLKSIDEVQSPARMAFTASGADRISMLYGLFVWLTPLWIAVSAWQVFRERRPDFRFFWIFACLSIVLMLFQMRFFYYGSLSLYVVPFWCFDQLRALRPRLSKAVVAVACVSALVSIVPSLKPILFTRIAPSLDPGYANVRGFFPYLNEACKRAPGVVLAAPNEGHYVRFHTQCPVIANNFRMTPQHGERLAYLEGLFDLSAQQLLEKAPEVRYIIASLIGPYTQQPDGSIKPTNDEVLRGINSPLEADLLLTDPKDLPARIRSIAVVNQPDLDFPIAGLFEVRAAEAGDSPGTAAPTTNSASDESDKSRH